MSILISASDSDRRIKTRSRVKSKKCRDLKPKWCKDMKSKFPETFGKECGKFGSKVPSFQKEAIEKFCCKTCKNWKPTRPVHSVKTPQKPIAFSKKKPCTFLNT